MLGGMITAWCCNIAGALLQLMLSEAWDAISPGMANTLGNAATATLHTT